MQKILVVGSSNMDMVAAVDSIPAKGETVMGLRLDKIPGGKGANQAYACAMLGGSTEFISMLGDDDLGALLRSNMRAAGYTFVPGSCKINGTTVADNPQTGINVGTILLLSSKTVTFNATIN